MSQKKGGEFSRFIKPLIEILREIGGSGSSREVTDAVIDKMNLSEEELSETLKNGASRVRNQVAWARQYCVSADLIDSSKRGVWSLTEQGFKHPLEADDIYNIVKAVRFTKPNTTNTNYEELIDTEPHETELLEILKSLSPAGFERICQRLLRESGFEQVVVTGKTNDGGIDGHGVLKLNPLVSFNVIFQCKRYKDSVSSPQIRDFRGAMAGRADKGIFITTGRFTQEAKKEARRDGVPPIELVDGEMLVNMFEQYELGVKPVTTYEIEHKFFNEYMS
ncbi:restriction endonuclease [Methylobacter tundripaludum]|uniref:Restriction endonuclease n=1 Tax=Methylobacter tundripaludum (strain ATCC BAA-1195 / DSM 17260 / SV96) TaxID=697282 RepID=G3IVD2_METTV|nr:restriction endonuclease [Methylobacter tundripaludum]EGW22859.1 restriction endonuclease [Methylobacter tundripaludum SV96]